MVFQASVFSQPFMKEYEDWREKHLSLTFKETKTHLSGHMKIQILAAVINDKL